MNEKRAQLNREGHTIVGSPGTRRTRSTFKLSQEPLTQIPEYLTLPDGKYDAYHDAALRLYRYLYTT